MERSPRHQTLAFPEWIFSPGTVPASAWALTSTKLVVVLLRVQLLDVLKVPRHAGSWAVAGPGLGLGLGLSLGLMLC